jgi:hypothetical protein
MGLKGLYSRIAYIRAAIGACSCIAMIAATVVGLAGVLGLPVVLALPDPFNSALQVAAQPLLILSLVLIVFSTMHSTSRTPLVLSLIGTPPTYAGMFLIPGGMSMTGVHTIHSVNPVPLLTFWSGVAILIGAILISRRKREPFQPIRRFVPIIAKRAALATALVGLLILVPSVPLAVISTVSLGQSTVTQQPASVRIETDNFLWKGTLTNYRREESYFPSFSAGRAVVTIKHKMTSGTLTIGIMDGMGAWVLIGKTVSSNASQTTIFTTENGMSGKWMIILTFNGVSGEIEISIKPL